LRKIDYANIEIVLVDNGSADGSAERLAAEFPEVRLIQNEKNLGFPAGNNVALRDALQRNPDYFLLLNNDTLVAPDFLSKLVKVAESDGKIGVVNPKILYFEPSDRIWFAGGFYKPWWNTGKVSGENRRDVGKYDDTREITFATGCAFLIKTGVVRQVGLLDEIFFLGFEDLDWTVRALQAGIRLLTTRRRTWASRSGIFTAPGTVFCLPASMLRQSTGHCFCSRWPNMWHTAPPGIFCGPSQRGSACYIAACGTGAQLNCEKDSS
jgi:GT2 family glycosyltransferase